MKNFQTKLIASAALMLLVLPVMAQGTPPGTPIDGGLSILLAAGGAYGAKKIYDKRKNN